MKREKAGTEMWLTGLFLFLCAGLCAAQVDPLFPPMGGQPGDYAVRRAGVPAGAFVRISITNDGLYKLSGSALEAVGVDPQSLTGSMMRLFNRTQEVAIAVSQSGLWTNGDYLVFFGTGRKAEYSDANVYWLGLESGGGLRMGSRDAAPIFGGVDVTSSVRVARYDRKTFIQDKYRVLDEGHDHWFCATIAETGQISLPIEAPQAITSQPATLTVVLYGHSSAAKINPDHLTRIWVNGKRVVSILFDGQVAVTQSCTVAGSLLRNKNAVAFRQYLRKGVPVDRVYLDRFQLEYTARLVLADGRLIFNGQTGGHRYRIGGLAAPEPVWLADVTDPAAPEWLLNAEADSGGNGAGIRFGDQPASGFRRYIACVDAGLMTPAGLERVAWADLGNPARQADYVIVAPADFVPPLQALAAKREGEGLRTVVVSLPDIYNEFSYGIEDAAAIKQFIGYTVHHWQAPAPRYVLLAGNGSYDPKGYLMAQRGLKAFKQKERIPVKMGPSDHGWAAIDGWYAAVGTNRGPVVALGRLPAETVQMMSNMIAKIVSFENVSKNNWRRKQALLVADRGDAALDGKVVCEWLRKSDFAPNGFWTTTAYTDDIGDAMVRNTVFSSMNAGVFLVYYFGHGNVSQWGHDIITYKDVALFKNTYTPLVLMMACRNGAFQNPVDGPSMMEALLQDKDNGASACIGTTAISYGASCVAFSDGFSEKLINEKSKRLGDSFLAGLKKLSDYNPYTQELLYVTLYADPAMIFNP